MFLLTNSQTPNPLFLRSQSPPTSLTVNFPLLAPGGPTTSARPVGIGMARRQGKYSDSRRGQDDRRHVPASGAAARLGRVHTAGAPPVSNRSLMRPVIGPTQAGCWRAGAVPNAAPQRLPMHALRCCGLGPPGRAHDLEVGVRLNQATQHWHTRNTRKRAMSFCSRHRVYESLVG